MYWKCRKWACFGRQDSRGKFNSSKMLRGIGTVVSIGYRKIRVPKICADQFGNRSVGPPKFRHFSVSLHFNVFISVLTWSNVSYLEVSWQSHKILHSWQIWTVKQHPNLMNVAAKLKKTQTTYYLPCLVPYLVQWWMNWVQRYALVLASGWWFWTKSLSFVSNIYC